MDAKIYTPQELFEAWKHYADPTYKNTDGVSLTEDMIRKWANKKEPLYECCCCGTHGTQLEMHIENVFCCPLCREFIYIQPYIPEWSDWG